MASRTNALVDSAKKELDKAKGLTNSMEGTTDGHSKVAAPPSYHSVYKQRVSAGVAPAPMNHEAEDVGAGIKANIQNAEAVKDVL